MATRTTYCKCGAMIKLTADSARQMDGVMAIWWAEHTGDGHGPATPAQALAGRAYNEYGGRPLEVDDDSQTYAWGELVVASREEADQARRLETMAAMDARDDDEG